MNIALITYYRSTNIGAVMQTYALCRYLKEQGHIIQLIDIRQDERANQSLVIKLIKGFVWWNRMRVLCKKYYPPLTRRYNSVKELKSDPPVADCYMVGSDQVWNPDISKDLCNAFFLDFGKNDIRRVSYASSFGLTEWPKQYDALKKEIKQLLNRFDFLSVREEQGKRLAFNEFGVSPIVVMDPTFLNECYPEFTKGTKIKNDILCYKLNRTEDFWNNIDFVSDTLGMKKTLLNYNYPKKGFRYCFNPSARTWMRKFAEAKFIVTDSFHGIAFSVINRKDFVAILNEDGKNSRLINLVQKLGLENRMFNTVAELKSNLSWIEPIDYQLVEDKLRILVSESRDYLNNSLK